MLENDRHYDHSTLRMGGGSGRQGKKKATVAGILSAEGSPKSENTRSTKTSLLLVRGGVLRAGDRVVSQINFRCTW